MTAAVEIERAAKDSFDAASGRVDKGAAPISDALQAETAYAQATFNRAKAEGDWQASLGQLSAEMNLPADSHPLLPAVEEGVQADADFKRSVSELMAEAQRSHPSVLQAEAQLRAARAKVDQVRAEGLPSVSLVAKGARNDQPISPAVGYAPYPAHGRDVSIGVQVNIPLFEGFSRTYQVRLAQAQTELQGVSLDQARSQVGLDVWTSYQALQTATQSLGNSAQLLALAQASERATQDRYVAGVGNILELLNAQSALAAAKRQRLQALTDWRAARLQLAGRLGRLGLWN